jgi:hypothetical protein
LAVRNPDLRVAIVANDFRYPTRAEEFDWQFLRFRIVREAATGRGCANKVRSPQQFGDAKLCTIERNLLDPHHDAEQVARTARAEGFALINVPAPRRMDVRMVGIGAPERSRFRPPPVDAKGVENFGLTSHDRGADVRGRNKAPASAWSRAHSVASLVL